MIERQEAQATPVDQRHNASGVFAISSSRAIFALIRKDLEQQAKHVTGLMALLSLAFCVSALLLRKDHLNAYVPGLAGFGIIGLLPMQLGQWLVTFERLQKTIKFLRILPVSAEEVVLAKFVTAFFFIAVSLLVFVFTPWAVGVYLFHATTSVTWKAFFLVYALSLLLAASSITLGMCFEKQVAVVSPYIGVGLLLAVLLYGFDKLHLDSTSFVRAIAESTTWQALAVLAAVLLWLAIMVGLYKLAVRGYQRIPV